MPGWFWALVALLGLLGVGLFSVAYQDAQKAPTLKDISPLGRTLGLAGLALLAWSVVLGVIGAVIAIAEAFVP